MGLEGVVLWSSNSTRLIVPAHGVELERLGWEACRLARHDHSRPFMTAGAERLESMTGLAGEVVPTRSDRVDKDPVGGMDASRT